MNFRLTHRCVLIVVIVLCVLLTATYYQKLIESLQYFDIQKIKAVVHERTQVRKVSEIQLKINEIFNQIDQKMPKVTFTHADNSTSANKSKMFIKNPKEKYCVGELLTVQVDAYDYLGKKKAYGGDYLRAMISNPYNKSGTSGMIEDLMNGSYYIHFTLFWEGNVEVAVFLMHPSEVVSALWKARNSWYGNFDYFGKFTSPAKQVEVKCGFNLTEEELCEYVDMRDEEYFYCVKPQNFSCDSFTEFKTLKTMATQLSNLENSLLVRSNVRVEIPKQIPVLYVSQCQNPVSSLKIPGSSPKIGPLFPELNPVVKRPWKPGVKVSLLQKQLPALLHISLLQFPYWSSLELAPRIPSSSRTFRWTLCPCGLARFQ